MLPFTILISTVLGSYAAVLPHNSPTIPSQTVPQCLQPPDSGLCLAYLQSFYYNANTGKCQTFIYGGCQGNANRFFNEEECMKTCGGTRVENTAASEELTEDICSLPSQPGLCYASFHRFFFNGETCEEFTYGGCGGNKNNFLTEEECLKSCPPKTKSMQDGLQKLPNFAEKVSAAVEVKSTAEEQSVAAAETRPQVPEKATAVAETRPQVPEKTIAVAETRPQVPEKTIAVAETRPQVPGNTTEDICSLPSQPGLCYAAFNRFFFNGVKCEEFTYGGCGGNKNNFETEEECLKTCPPKSKSVQENNMEIATA